MKKINITFILMIIFLLTNASVFSQKAIAFKIFKGNGHKTSYKKLVKSASNAQLVFFGEEHNNPIAHWLELKITKDLFNKKQGNIILGAEMLESDNQQEYSKYLDGKIDYKDLKKQARLWPNFKTDYKPLLDFAAKNKLNFIATNIPRKFASKVFHGGFEALDSLSSQDKKWIAPLPIKYDSTLTDYAAMKKMEHVKFMPKAMQDNMPKAQAIKDATMAYFILKHYNPDKIFIHYNGSYHSNDYQGIVWYIKQAQPSLKILTIDLVTQNQLKKLDPENKHKADFIIVVDQDMTKTY